MPRLCISAGLLNLLVFLAPAHAHFPWVQIDKGAGKHDAALVHFEEAPRAGDGKYLGPFVERGQLWVNLPGKKPTLLETAEVQQNGKRWVQAELPAAAPRSADFYAKWGVYRYGKTDVLLHYYARNVDVHNAEQMKQVSAAGHLELHLQPRWEDGELFVRLVWQGKPLAGRKILVRGRGKQPLVTDEDGKAHFSVDKPGLVHMRTYIQQNESGEFDGKTYERIHRHTTLTLRLPPK